MGEPKVTWTDSRLIRECVRGNERAWSALIAKYKGLIYSIPMKYGATPDDAADVFQSVCLELFAELPRLRKVASSLAEAKTLARLVDDLGGPKLIASLDGR